MANHLNEPWRTVASYAIPPLALLVYKYQGEVADWIVGKIRDSNDRREARGACKGIQRLIAEYKKRLESPDLDPGTREDIAARLIELERSLTDQQRTASLGNP